MGIPVLKRQLVAPLFSIILAHAGEDPAVQELKNVARTYRNLETLQVQATSWMIRERQGTLVTLNVPVFLIFSQPDHYRIEVHHPWIRTILIDDGQQRIEYDAARKSLHRFLGATTRALFTPTLAVGAGPGEMLYNSIADDLLSARFVENYASSFENPAIKAIEARYRLRESQPLVFVFWVDMQRHVVIQRSVKTNGKRLLVVRISSIRLNAPIAPSTFTLDVPSDLNQGASKGTRSPSR